MNPETFFEFAGDANEAINGNNATLPSQLTEFVSKIDSSLYLALAAGNINKDTVDHTYI